ncbi:MAG: hypothetical protein ACRC0M_11180 [Legionella sp.]
MQRTTRTLSTFIILSQLCATVWAGPWFTGPLLAPQGHTIPNGHTNVEIYGMGAFTDGQYSAEGRRIDTPQFRSGIVNPIITHGYTDWLDVQLNIPYVFNNTQGAHYNRLADVAIALGLQVVEQKGSPKRMDVRFLLQEIFPTGKYDHLNPEAFGTDSTGLGSYQTQLGINFQHLLEVFNAHYLRTRLIFSRIYTSPVTIHGFSSYGGSASTSGSVNPGIGSSVDLAFEYTLTQNWVAVMEATYSKGQSTRFNGVLNFNNMGQEETIVGHNNFYKTTLAPALEYNFNGNVGLIAGVWFPVAGRSTSHFMTYVMALNMYW